jgi:hypothetical protein
MRLLRAKYAKGAPAGATLQANLSAALIALVDLDGTSLLDSDHGFMRVNKNQITSGVTELKITSFMPQELATTVPIKLKDAAAPEASASAPVDQAFKTSEYFALIKDNYIIGIGDGLRIEAVSRYLSNLSVQAGMPANHAAFEVTPVPNIDKLKVIQKEGVRSIELDATLHAATLQFQVQDKRLRGPFVNALRSLKDGADALVGKNKSAELMDHLGSIEVKLEIKVAGGLTGPVVARDYIQKAAAEILAAKKTLRSESVDARFITSKGTPVSLDDVVIGEQVRLPRRDHENSLRDLETWSALWAFLKKIQADGII